MKQVCLLMTVIVIPGLFVAYAIGGCNASYKWDKDHEAHWLLADKQASIPKKLEHLSAFTESLTPLRGKGLNTAVMLPTDNTSFDGNFDALVSLRDRLSELQEMDVKSVEYQMAMQQITQQEWAEAGAMIASLRECWYRGEAWLWWQPVIHAVILALITLWIWCAVAAERHYRFLG